MTTSPSEIAKPQKAMPITAKNRSAGSYLPAGAQAHPLRVLASTAGRKPTPAEWPHSSCSGAAATASVRRRLNTGVQNGAEP